MLEAKFRDDSYTCALDLIYKVFENHLLCNHLYFINKIISIDFTLILLYWQKVNQMYSML